MSTPMAVIVSGSPTLSEAHNSALHFIENVYSGPHRIDYVFFYADATQVAKSTPATESDNGSILIRELSQAWKKLGNRYQFPLIACVSAALKRGIIDDKELADQLQTKHLNKNLCDGFQLEGFSFLAESINNHQKIIEFCG